MLVLRLSSPEASEFSYAQFKRDALSAEWVYCTWEQGKDLLRKTNPSVVLIPTREVLLTEVKLKARNQRQLRQALPFALEESIIGEPEEQHYVWHSKPQGNDLLHVAIIEHQRLQTWVTFLHSHGMNPSLLLPDVFSLPFAEKGFTIWQQQQGLWVRHGAYGGFYSPATLLPSYLSELAQPASIPTSPKPSNDKTAKIETAAEGETPTKIPIRLLHDAQVELNLPETLDVQYETQATHIMRSHLMAAQALNLLQGFRTEARSKLTEQWHLWRPTLLVATLLLIIAGGVEVLEIRQLSQTQAQLQQANRQQYQALFPEAGPLDPRLNLRSAITQQITQRQRQNTQQTTEASPLPLMQVLSSIIPKQGNQLVLKRLEWRQEKLTLTFEANSPQQVQQLEQQLQEVLGEDIRIPYSRTSGRIEGILTLSKEQAG